MSTLIGSTKVNLIQTDCTEGMRRLSRKSHDVVVTSPPYNLKKKYRTYKDNKPLHEYLEWTDAWVSEVREVLDDKGSFFLNIGATSKNPMLPFQVLAVCAKHFYLQNTFHWIKSISITRGEKTDSYGHFKPINSKRFVNDLHEYVFHFTKDANVAIDRLAVGVPYADKSNIKRWAHTQKRDIRCRGNTWFIPYQTITSSNKQRPHPATFPPELAEMCILVHGRTNPVVLDPFVGLGNSSIAAVRCKASMFTGFDIDDFYLVESLKRTENYVQPSTHR